MFETRSNNGIVWRTKGNAFVYAMVGSDDDDGQRRWFWVKESFSPKTGRSSGRVRWEDVPVVLRKIAAEWLAEKASAK